MPGETTRPAATKQSFAPEQTTGESSRAPFSLKIVGFLFLLEGTMGITGMLLKVFVIKRGMTIDMAAFVTPFVGYGLLRGKEWSRKLALFLTLLLLVAFGVGIVASITMVTFGMPQSTRIEAFGKTFSPLLTMIVFMAGASYCVWQVWVLKRKNVIEFFRATRHERIARHTANTERARSRQFSLSTIFMITLLAAFAMLRICADDVQYVESSQFRSTSNGPFDNRNLRYGVKSSRFFDSPDRLTYLLLYRAGDAVRSTSGSARSSNFVTTPDGHKISPSSPYQLYEVVDGQTHSREERITLEELIRYVESRPADWSLEALVRHAEQSRAKE